MFAFLANRNIYNGAREKEGARGKGERRIREGEKVQPTYLARMVGVLVMALTKFNVFQSEQLPSVLSDQSGSTADCTLLPTRNAKGPSRLKTK